MNRYFLVLLTLGASVATLPALAGAVIEKPAPQPAAATDSGAAPERAAAVDATTPAAVPGAAPAPQRGAGAPIGAATDAAVPASPLAVDWSYTPRRSFQGRRR